MKLYYSIQPNCCSIIFSVSDVKELTQQCVGGYDLLQQRQKVQALCEETNQHLKKNVYQNYMQFIETAKEISCKSYILRSSNFTFS
jgi:hypothetical protein